MNLYTRIMKGIYMIKDKKKRLLRTVISLMCVVTLASSSMLVHASPSAKDLEKKTSDLEKKTSNLESELSALNSELSALSDELKSTTAKINNLTESIEKSKLDLAAAKLNEESQYEAMAERIKFMYEGGNISLIHILCSSDSMADFLNKAEYVSTISDYDREMLREFQVVRIDIERKQQKLEEQQAELARLQKNLDSQKNALSSKISSTSGELKEYKNQLKKAKEAEAALKAAQNESSSNIVGGDPSAPVSVSDVALLAGILQCEAGNSYEGMIAVGTVIMNRIASPRFPNTLKGVVYQKGQFSPAMSGWLERVLAKGPNVSAYAAAKEVLAGKRHKKVEDCLFFNAAWTGKKGVNVGGNVFW